MDSGLFSAIQVLVSKSWSLISSIDFPGTHISLAIVMLGSALAVFSLNLLGSIFWFSVEGDVHALGKEYQKGGNNKKIKISDSRKGDTH